MSTIQKRQLWLKLGRTLNLNLGIFGMGLILSLTGVTLLDMAEICHTDVTLASHLITSRCVGSLVGSLAGGRLFDKYNTQVMCIATQVISMVTTLLIPIGGSIQLALTMSLISGLGLGAFDTGSNVWILKLWPENASPALQVFHLCFGVGSFIAPLIAEPFLSTRATNFYNESFSYNQTLLGNASITPNSSNASIGDVVYGSRVQIPFGIVSAFHLVLVISMVVLYCIDGTDFKPQKTSRTDSIGSQKEVEEDIQFTRITLVLLAAYVCVYVALECTCGQMFTSYAVMGELRFPKSSASRLQAAYFLCFTVSRTVAALVTIKVTSFQMLVVSHVILIFTGSILLVWGASSEIVLWACSALMGLGQGPLYAAVVAWAVSYINMTNQMMSLIIITAVVGALSPPLLVGQFLDSCPEAFLYVCFVTVFLCAAMFVSTALYVRRRPMIRPENEKSKSVTVEEADYPFSL